MRNQFFLLVLGIAVLQMLCAPSRALEADDESAGIESVATQSGSIPEYPPLELKPEGKPSRYGFVAKLIEVSSGAKQVRASDNAEVINTIRRPAVCLYRPATAKIRRR